MSRPESPCRMRTRTWRSANNSNLRLALALRSKERSVPSWESSNRVLPDNPAGSKLREATGQHELQF
jgi:hypothetical protein